MWVPTWWDPLGLIKADTRPRSLTQTLRHQLLRGATHGCRSKTTTWREKGRTRSRRIMHGSCSSARKNQIKNNVLKKAARNAGWCNTTAADADLLDPDRTNVEKWQCLLKWWRRGGKPLRNSRKILKAFFSEPQLPRKCSIPLPHRLSHTDSSSKSPMGKYSASLFPEGASNQNKWFRDRLSCCQLYIPALYVTYIRFPHEETPNTIPASMLFNLNMKPNLYSYAKIHCDADSKQ